MDNRIVTLKTFTDRIEIQGTTFILLRFVPYLPLPFSYIYHGMELRKFDDKFFEQDKKVAPFADWYTGGLFFAMLLAMLSFAVFQDSPIICCLIITCVAIFWMLFRITHAYGRIFCGYSNVPQTKGIKIYLVPKVTTVLINIVYVFVLASVSIINYWVILNYGGNFLTVLIYPVFWGIFLPDTIVSTPMTYSSKYKIRKIIQNGEEISFEQLKEILPEGKIPVKKILTKPEVKKQRRNNLLTILVIVFLILFWFLRFYMDGIL